MRAPRLLAGDRRHHRRAWQFGHGTLGLVEVGGGEDDPGAAAQLLQAEPPGGVVLAENGDETVPFGITEQDAGRRATCAVHGL